MEINLLKHADEAINDAGEEKFCKTISYLESWSAKSKCFRVDGDKEKLVYTMRITMLLKKTFQFHVGK